MGRRHRLGIVQANRPVIRATRTSNHQVIPPSGPGAGVDNILLGNNSDNLLLGTATDVFLKV